MNREAHAVFGLRGWRLWPFSLTMNLPMDSKRSRIGLFLSLNALNPLGILVAGFRGPRREVGLRGILNPALPRGPEAGRAKSFAGKGSKFSSSSFVPILVLGKRLRNRGRGRRTRTSTKRRLHRRVGATERPFVQSRFELAACGIRVHPRDPRAETSFPGLT